MTNVVQWTMFSDSDPWQPFGEFMISDMPRGLCDMSCGRSVAAMLAQNYFDDDEWDAQFGLEETVRSVWVQLHTPTRIEGFYEVEMRRVTQAEVSTVTQTDPRLT